MICGGALGVMVIFIEKKVTWVQIQDKAVWISHSTNILDKGMSPIILPPSMGK